MWRFGPPSRLLRYAYRYPDRTVWLDMWLVTDWSGEPHPHDGQALAWVEPSRLGEHDLLEADRPIVEALRQGAVVQAQFGAGNLSLISGVAGRATPGPC